jgi:hypothetical protein
VYDPAEDADPDRSNVATIAILGFMAGLILWLGGACLVLGAGGSGGTSALEPRAISTPLAASPTATRPADRTDCNQIRGTEYRSEAERQWFLAHCQ